jgi:hypothetical protein
MVAFILLKIRGIEMSEPQAFENQDSGGRKYVCFVCGVPFDTYPQYKEHILASHEEGREFVKCPLARCQAPVRDMKLHFKVKHPTEKLPHSGQMRALIWTDQKAPKKKKKPQYHEGYIASQKNGGQQMHYRSGWERDVYMCLENWDEVVSYKVENFPVEYYWKGRRKRYFPDLFIGFKDGHYEVWEIKPNNQNQLEMNKAKWMACESHCESRNWIFKVINESHISKLKQTVKMEIGMKIDNANTSTPELPIDFSDNK